MIRTWFVTLERIVGTSLPPLKTALVKVGLDQLGFAPFFNVIFISSLSALQGTHNFIDASGSLVLIDLIMPKIQ